MECGLHGQVPLHSPAAESVRPIPKMQHFPEPQERDKHIRLSPEVAVFCLKSIALGVLLYFWQLRWLMSSRHPLSAS